MKNNTVVFAGGTGHPFSTDTGAALRGCEIEVDALLFAKILTESMILILS